MFSDRVEERMEEFKEALEEANETPENRSTSFHASRVEFILVREEPGQDVEIPDPPDGWEVDDHIHLVEGMDGDGDEAQEYLIVLTPENQAEQ